MQSSQTATSGLTLSGFAEGVGKKSADSL